MAKVEPILHKILALLSALPITVIWQTLISLILFTLLLLMIRNRKSLKTINKAQQQCEELDKILLEEQKAHEDTKRYLEKRKAGLLRTAEKISALREQLRKKDQELNEQTEELIKFQDWRRALEKEKSEQEKDKQRHEEEIEREELVFNTIYKYYDEFSKPIFSSLDTDSCRGTYHHVLTVATVAGLAAESINLPPEFVRAAAYFHDLGKAFHPKYFKENWGYNEEQGWRQENEEYSFYHRGQMILSHLPLGRKSSKNI